MEEGRREHPNGGSEACLQFDRELAAHLGGEARPELVAHARECVFCGVILGDLEAVIARADSLPLISPPERVWTNIRAALVAEGIIHEPESAWKRWFSPLNLLGRPAPVTALAGLVVLAIALTAPPQTSVSPSFSSSSSSSGSSFEEPSTAALTSTLVDMEKNYQSRKTALEPTVQETYERSLASLDHSIRECKDSVEKDPNNALAREYLVAAYEQKAQVLSTALEYDSQ